jgi:RNA polymerase sigma-70 factor (ECF subfamily)
VTGDPARDEDRVSGFLRLYDEALPKVYGYLLSRCGHVATAEELTSETWLAAAAAQPSAALSTAWVIGIARHKLVDHWRREGRERRKLRAVAAEAPAGGAEGPWVERIDVLHARETLQRLSPNHRAALTLRYVDDLPVAQVARLLGRSEHSTESLLARARVAFRTEYAREADDA